MTSTTRSAGRPRTRVMAEISAPGRRISRGDEPVLLEPAAKLLLVEGETLQLEPDGADLGRDRARVLRGELVRRHRGERHLQRLQLTHEPGRERTRRHDTPALPRRGAGSNSGDHAVH